MFVLKDEVKCWWPVKVNVPDDKVAGRFIQHTFDVEFTLVDRDRAQEQSDERNAILNSGKPTDEIVRELEAFDDTTWLKAISNWRGVFDQDKTEVPFSSDLLARALKQPLTRKAIQEAYAELASGEVRRKN